MKKIIAFILSLLIILSLTGCTTGNSAKNNKINIVTTIFPLYDWLRALTENSENVNITMLIDSGVDLHSFEPSVEDIVKISSSDMFVYVGGESDKWVGDALKENKNNDLISLNLFETLGEKKLQEELKEGMQGEEEEEAEETEYDEHIWLSLKNAKVLCEAICEDLCIADTKNAQIYRKNYEAYLAELDSLDNQYEKAVSESKNKTLVFGDRFPFRYLTEDYGIDYYAAFIGCSAESEASFKTVAFLANKVDDLGLNSIIKIESSDGLIAKTVNENTKNKSAKILTLNSMQSLTSNDIKDGQTYIGICRQNLKVLREALN